MIIEDKDKFRIETSRMVLLELLSNTKLQFPPRNFAKDAVSLTDALIMELEETKSPQIADTKHPIIDKGYVKITAYTGISKYIQVGKIYKGDTYSVGNGKIRGRLKTEIKSCPFAYFDENNANWVQATIEEYNEQN